MLQLKNPKPTLKIINGEEVPVKVYKNTVTGNDLTVYWIRKDIEGVDWWAFEDLYQLPFIRYVTAKKVIELYGHGLSLQDIKGLTGQIKSILKTNSPDKYEMAFAKVLELENLSESLADPIKQSLGLCVVYLLRGDEQPDVFSNHEASVKMAALAADPASQAFFLNWWTSSITHYGTVLKGLSALVSKATEMSPPTGQRSN